MDRADKALYEAKNAGRNQVKSAEELTKATAVNA
jgi:PleD family two-component response regulator